MSMSKSKLYFDSSRLQTFAWELICCRDAFGWETLSTVFFPVPVCPDLSLSGNIITSRE